jgi:catechol 2,3-dioxygenase-like lactoylglutathione lyase family enzyme
MSIGYVTIGAQDVDAALPFFDATFGALGYERGEPEGGWAFYGPKGNPCIGICRPNDGQAARAGNGIMIAFKADQKEQVAAAHAAALANGGSDEGGPGFRPPEGTSFYGAYFRDPVGNKFCVYWTP